MYTPTFQFIPRVTWIPSSVLRSEIIRKALIEQLKESEETLRSSKATLEHALGPTEGLTAANLAFKDQIKHANMHLPKPKAKAKAKAITNGTTA